jgi:hypothetical protein
MHLSPILGAVIDVQDFNRFGLDGIDYDVGEWREH